MTAYRLAITVPGIPPATRTITAGPGDLAQAVHGHVRGLLGSARVDIRLDPDALAGEITNHGVAAGTFALAPEVSAPARRGRVPMHGYSAAAIDDVARHAIALDRWRSGDVEERTAVARFAIVEHLCTAEEPVTRRELIGVGLRAADRYVVREMHHHGWDIDNVAAGGGAMAGYQRYWQAGPGASPERGVVERAALAQIWPQLTPRQRQALEALRDAGDYAQAAASLGVTDGTFRVLISSARRRFLLWWHEGETPSKTWRTDRHLYSRDGMCRGKRQLTVSEVERLRDRYQDEEGPTLTVLAAEVGVHKSTLSALLRGRTRPAPDPVDEAADAA